MRNGIFDTGRKFIDGGEAYSVLTPNVERFDAKEIESLLSGFPFCMHRKHVGRPPKS